MTWHLPLVTPKLVAYTLVPPGDMSLAAGDTQAGCTHPGALVAQFGGVIRSRRGQGGERRAGLSGEIVRRIAALSAGQPD